MKVLNLCCSNEHRFEGWFASHDDYRSQDQRHLIACPICGDTAIERRPSAPRLNVATPRGDAIPPPPAPPAAPVPAAGARDMLPAASDLQVRAHGAWLRAVRALVDRTEDVGDRFPEEARRIHYGETEERGIRGQATADDVEALRDEGIEIFPLPMPEALKGPVQ